MTTLTANPAPSKKPRRWLRLLTALLALCLLILLSALAAIVWLMLGPGIQVPTTPVTLTRSPTGQFPQPPSPSPQLSIYATTLESNLTTKSKCFGNSTHGAKLFAHNAVVIADSNAPLDRSIAYAIFLNLQAVPSFQQVSYFPSGTWSVNGQALPDVVIHVATESFTESGIFKKDFKAKVKVTASDAGFHFNVAYIDAFSPPFNTFSDQNTIGCTATQWGLESAGTRYHALANNIAKSASDHIATYIADTSQKLGLAGTQPPEFFPAYTPTPNLPFLQANSARQISSGTCFMMSNCTLWEATGIPLDARTVDAVNTDLKALGWNVDHNAFVPSERHFRAESPDWSQTLELDWSPATSSGNNAPPICHIAYTHRMSRAQIADALKALLATNPTPQELLVYEKFWWFQLPLMKAYFLKNHTQSTPALMLLTYDLIAQKRNDDARKLLLRADALARLEDPGLISPPAAIESYAKTIGLTQFPKYPDVYALDPAERVDLSKDLPTTRTVGIDNCIVLIGQNTPDHVEAVRLSPSRNPPYSFTVHQVRLSKESSSWSTDPTAGPTGNSGTTTLKVGPKSVTITHRFDPATNTFELKFQQSQPATHQTKTVQN